MNPNYPRLYSSQPIQLTCSIPVCYSLFAAQHVALPITQLAFQKPVHDLRRYLHIAPPTSYKNGAVNEPNVPQTRDNGDTNPTGRRGRRPSNECLKAMETVYLGGHVGAFAQWRLKNNCEGHFVTRPHQTLRPSGERSCAPAQSR